MALQYVTLTGDLGTTAANAQATFTASNWIVDASDELLIPPGEAGASGLGKAAMAKLKPYRRTI